MPSEAGGVFWGDAINEVAFNFQQWASYLVMLKPQLADAGIASSLPDQLKQQQDGMRSFTTVLLTKVYETQRQVVTNKMAPVYGYSDCAMQALSSASSTVTFCAKSNAATTTGGGTATKTSGNAAATTANAAAKSGALAAAPVLVARAIVLGDSWF